MQGRKIAITGAVRSLGAALAIVAADRGARPILLGRSLHGLQATAEIIRTRTGVASPVIVCDLADLSSVAEAADRIARDHRDLDALINSGAQWSGGALETLSDANIASTVGSMLTGTIALTRHLLPILRSRPRADIHTVVSMSGLQYARLRGVSVAFRAAKAGQDGFVQGLSEELAGTAIRVTAVYPGIIEDVAPTDPRWLEERGPDGMLTNREVVDAILFALEMPANTAIRSLVIERNRSDFLTG